MTTVLTKSLMYILASLLLLISTSHSAIWNKVNLSLNFNSPYFGIAVADNQVFIAASVSGLQLRSFDVETQTTTLLAQMPTNQAGDGAFCADRNGTLYLLYSNIFSTYNVSSDVWMAGPAGFTSRTYGHCVLNPFTNQIHFLGGSSTAHDVFDIDTQSWNTTWPELPTITNRLQQVYFDEVDQKIYVAGGSGAAVFYLVQVYHFSNHSWTPLAAPYLIQGDGVIRIGDELQLIGGETATGDKRRIQYYNLLDETWTTDLPLLAQQVNPGNAFLLGTTIYLLNAYSLQWAHCYAVDYCGSSTNCLTVGCNATTGECANEFLENSCDDGDLCTMNDMCQLGVCAPGNEMNPSCVPVSEPLTSEPITGQPLSNEPFAAPVASQPTVNSPSKQVSGTTSLISFVPSVLISWLVSALL
eukprot:TRINITY_DN610_c0_g1_i1.p1 TRINITY_DN610_c0_g1~~TRINITY_DN610_c0_g1_i1.p1  ORF type:complete len:413 (+),score=40.66 TRINITY_DN610_c0_g1_i1:75-1313(+)